MLELKKDKVIDYVFSWKSKGVYNPKLKPLYNTFLHSVKHFGYKMGIKFDKDSLAVEQNNYLTKIVNVYIGYDLDAWPRNPIGSPEKTFSFNFIKANTKFCLSLHYNADNGYLFVNGKEIFKFKANNKNVNSPIQFCLGSISNEFSNT